MPLSTSEASLILSSSLDVDDVTPSSSIADMTSSIVAMTTEQTTTTSTTAKPSTTSSSTTTESLKPNPQSDTLYIENRVDASNYKQLETVILTAFKEMNPKMLCCFEVLVNTSVRYVDVQGRQLLRVDYMLTPIPPDSSQPAATTLEVWDRIDLLLNNTAVFSSRHNRVYRGQRFGPEEIFHVFLIGPVYREMYRNIERVIGDAWRDVLRDCNCRITSRVLTVERFVGVYGMWLTEISYIVFKDGAVQPVSTVERPNAKLLESLFQSEKSLNEIVYLTDSIPYSRHYTLPLNTTRSLSSTEGRITNETVVAMWRKYFIDQRRCSSCDIRAVFTRPAPRYTSDGRLTSSWDYFIFLNNVLMNPAQVPGPTHFSGVDLCSTDCQHQPVQHFYTHDFASFFKVQSVVDEVFVSGGATVVDRLTYCDHSGRLMTKVLFHPNNFGQHPDLAMPTEVNNSLSLHHLSMPARGLPLSRVYQLLIDDVQLINDTLPAIADLLQRSWAATNGDISTSDIDVTVINMDTLGYMQPDGSNLTVIQYKVTVAKADSSLTIAEPPTLDTLRQSITSGLAGVLTPGQLCDCDVRTRFSLTTQGDFNLTDSPDLDVVEKAIAQSWRDSNPDFLGNVTVAIHNIAAKNDTDDNLLQTITFTIDLAGGPRGLTDRDLDRPRDDVIQASLRAHGVDVKVVEPSEVSVEQPEDDDSVPWYIPVAIVLALLVLIIIIVIILLIIRDRR